MIINYNGRALFDDIIHGVESTNLESLFFERSESLKRLMTRDANSSLMISTVA